MGCKTGEIWNPEVIADRIRRGLDVIGNTVGGLLYRGPDYWEVLPPGDEGQALIVEDGVPVWGDYVPPTQYTLWTDDFSRNTSDMKQFYHQIGVASNIPVVTSGTWALQATTPQITGSPHVFWIPAALVDVRAQNQFCEAEYRGVSTGAARGYWAVLAVTDGRFTGTPAAGFNGVHQAYYLVTATSISAFVLRRFKNGVATQLGANFSVPAIGTIVALTALDAGGGNITLEVFYDGVSQGTRSDNQNLMAGMPGLGCVDAAGSTSWKNLRAGLLTLF